MMRTAALVLLALLALLAGPAAAGVFRVDEAGTVVSQPVVAMKWRALVPGRAADNTIEAALRVDVRLNLQPWLNRPARIYLVLNPLPSGERIHARWNTQGRLMQGSLYSGERALVYEGPAQPATLTDSLLLALDANGDRIEQAQTLSFHFEIEVAP